jgi:hypothetical protein
MVIMDPSTGKKMKHDEAMILRPSIGTKMITKNAALTIR